MMRCGELNNKIQEFFPHCYFVMNGKTWSVSCCRRLTSVGGCMNFSAKLLFVIHDNNGTGRFWAGQKRVTKFLVREFRLLMSIDCLQYPRTINIMWQLRMYLNCVHVSVEVWSVLLSCPWFKSLPYRDFKSSWTMFKTSLFVRWWRRLWHHHYRFTRFHFPRRMGTKAAIPEISFNTLGLFFRKVTYLRYDAPSDML
jgi:hypothetical protein